jgi:tripartite-type tricarboxylate transporter receptor subunit TctC
MKKTLLALACARRCRPWLRTPTSPVTIVVPFAAGGPTDKVARDLAEALRKGLNNQTVVIENVGGAGGTLGAAKVAKAAPDGYTCCCTTSAWPPRRRCTATCPSSRSTTSSTSAWSTTCR